MERFVEDLEEIRQTIEAERMVLIGHSWGGMLASYYAAAHPNRVAKLVFHSPGPIWISAAAPPFEFERTAAPNPYANLPSSRVVAAFALANVNVTAAENLVPQAEMGIWQLHTLDPRELVQGRDGQTAS